MKTKYERSYNICLTMLNKRGYQIVSQDDDQIHALKQDGSPLIVFFFKEDKFNVKNIQIYISQMKDMLLSHAIIIYAENITSFTKKIVRQSTDMKFELFPQTDLQYDITTHVLQPKFEKLSTDAAMLFKKKFGVKISKMRKEDPIARFYCYNKGDIVRVTRKNEYVDYRIVK